MADAVEHDLRDGSLTVDALAARLVINCIREALQRLRPRGGRAFECEGRGGWVRSPRYGDLLVDPERLIGCQLPNEHGWRHRGRGPLFPWRFRRRMCGSADRRHNGQTQDSKTD